MKVINFVKEKILRNKKIMLTALVISIGVLVLPFFASANAVATALYTILGLIFHIILWFEGFLLQLAGTAIDTVLGSALAVHTTPVVQGAWALSRDAANMIFIIALLVIAFATIFNIEAYQYKALLPKLIMGVLLVNFSRTICTIFIEFSNLLTAAFLNFDQSRTTTAVIMAILGVQSVTEVRSRAGIEWIIDEAGMLMALIGIVVIVGFLVVVLVAFAGMLILRTIALLTLIVISPFAFAMGILPATKQMCDEWWQQFTQYILYTPLAAFGLYLALRAAQDINQYGTKGTGGMLGIKEKGFKTDAAAQEAILPSSTVPISFAGDATQMYNFLLVIGLLFFTIMMVKKAGGFLASFGIGLAKMGVLALPKLAGAAGKRGGKKMLGGIGRRINRGLGSAGKEGSWADRLGQKVGGFVGGNKEKWGKAMRGVSLLSPTVLGHAWDAKQAKLDKEAFGESSGWARMVLNKATLSKDTTDYAHIEHERGVGERMKEMELGAKNGGHAYLTQELLRTAKQGDRMGSESALRLLSPRNNFNEAMRQIGSNPAFDKSLFHSQEEIERQFQHYKPIVEDEMREKKAGESIRSKNAANAATGEAALTTDEEDSIYAATTLTGDEKTVAEQGARERESFDIKSRRDLLQKLLGKNHAKYVELDFGEDGKRRGDGSASEAYVYQEGEFKLQNEDAQALSSAIELSKMGAGKRMDQTRFNISVKGYDKNKNEISEKLDHGFAFGAMEVGYSDQELAERNFGNFHANARQDLVAMEGRKSKVGSVRHLVGSAGRADMLEKFIRANAKEGEDRATTVGKLGGNTFLAKKETQYKANAEQLLKFLHQAKTGTIIKEADWARIRDTEYAGALD